MATVEAPIRPHVVQVWPLPPAKSKWRRHLWILGAGCLALIVIILVLLPPKIPVTRLFAMTLRDEAAGTGFVRAKVSIGVGAKINGVVLKVYVDQGDVVKKGQLLAELHNLDFKSQFGQATSLAQAQKATVDSAQANRSASSGHRADARLKARLTGTGAGSFKSGQQNRAL